MSACRQPTALSPNGPACELQGPKTARTTASKSRRALVSLDGTFPAVVLAFMTLRCGKQRHDDLVDRREVDVVHPRHLCAVRVGLLAVVVRVDAEAQRFDFVDECVTRVSRHSSKLAG